MSKFHFSKKLVSIFGSIFVLFSITLYLIFLPFIDIRKAIALDDSRYKSMEIVVNSYNPLSPRISLITKVEDGYIITVEDYERNGLNTFKPTGFVNGQRKGAGFDQINSKVTGKSLEETIKIVKEQDQSNQPFAEQKSQTEKDFQEEEKKPVECRKPVRVTKTYQESEFKPIFKGITYSDPEIVRLEGETFRDNNKNYIFSVNVNNDRVIKYNFYFGNKNPAIYDNSQIRLEKLTKVYADCREEEIPLPNK